MIFRACISARISANENHRAVLVEGSRARDRLATADAPTALEKHCMINQLSILLLYMTSHVIAPPSWLPIVEPIPGQTKVPR
jgi:hypothetical protein